MAGELEDQEAYGIEGIDLRELDLDHIQLDELEEPDPQRWRAIALVSLIACGLGLLWLPNTTFYRASGQTQWVFFAVCAAATGIGILSGRWLWQWGEEQARRYALRNQARGDRPGRAQTPAAPPSALRRWLTFFCALGGTLAIVLAAPQGGYLVGGGTGYTVGWFAASAGALVVGFLASRFIVMHGARPAARQRRAPSATLALPPWTKWATLVFILLLGATAAFGDRLFPRADPDEVRFTLGSVGLVVGVLGAIWLARRFDETEQRLREETRRRAAIARPPPHPRG